MSKAPGQPSDRILLVGVGFRGHHGASDPEQDLGGAYEVDVELQADLSAACASDRVEDTLDYSLAFEVVMEVGTQRRFRLLEALAESIAQELLRRLPAERVRIQVRKLNPPLEGVVSYSAVEILRSAGSGASGDAG